MGFISLLSILKLFFVPKNKQYTLTLINIKDGLGSDHKQNIKNYDILFTYIYLLGKDSKSNFGSGLTHQPSP